MFWKLFEAFWAPTARTAQRREPDASAPSHIEPPTPAAAANTSAVVPGDFAPWSAPMNRPGEPGDWRILLGHLSVSLVPEALPLLLEAVADVRDTEMPFGLFFDPEALSDGPVRRVQFWCGADRKRVIDIGAISGLPPDRTDLAVTLRSVQPDPEDPGVILVTVDVLEPRSAPKPGPETLLSGLDRSKSGPGTVDGAHFVDYVEVVKAFKREGRYDEAAALLERLIGAIEEEVDAMGHTPPPWYFDQLRIVSNRRKDPDAAKQAKIRFEALLARSNRRSGAGRA